MMTGFGPFRRLVLQPSTYLTRDKCSTSELHSQPLNHLFNCVSGIFITPLIKLFSYFWIFRGICIFPMGIFICFWKIYFWNHLCDLYVYTFSIICYRIMDASLYALKLEVLSFFVFLFQYHVGYSRCFSLPDKQRNKFAKYV